MSWGGDPVAEPNGLPDSPGSKQIQKLSNMSDYIRRAPNKVKNPATCQIGTSASVVCWFLSSTDTQVKIEWLVKSNGSGH